MLSTMASPSLNPTPTQPLRRELRLELQNSRQESQGYLLMLNVPTIHTYITGAYSIRLPNV